MSWADDLNNAINTWNQNVEDFQDNISILSRTAKGAAVDVPPEQPKASGFKLDMKWIALGVVAVVMLIALASKKSKILGL